MDVHSFGDSDKQGCPDFGHLLVVLFGWWLRFGTRPFLMMSIQGSGILPGICMVYCLKIWLEGYRISRMRHPVLFLGGFLLYAPNYFSLVGILAACPLSPPARRTECDFHCAALEISSDEVN